MIKRHYVVIGNDDGENERFPMKQWLREHPEILPGVDPTHTTAHQLRRALRKLGWRVEERSDRVLIFEPDSSGDFPLSEEEIDQDISEDEIVIEAEEITFSLERDLQSALRANIAQLETGLEIIDGGKECALEEAGRIDITARDAKGSIVVIELKAGTAKPEVVAQILAYMGTVSEDSNQPVRWILIAGDFHKRVILAALAVPNLELKRYSFQFKFDSAK